MTSVMTLTQEEVSLFILDVLDFEKFTQGREEEKRTEERGGVGVYQRGETAESLLFEEYNIDFLGSHSQGFIWSSLIHNKNSIKNFNTS